MIICQKCKKNVATVHVTEIVKKAKHEIHLCEQCARDQNITGVPVQGVLNVTELLSNLLGQPGGAESASLGDKTCPECGIRYSEFRSGGRLGCPNDYEVFSDALMPLIEKVHGATEHIGKVPATQGHRVCRAAEIRRTKARLREAVATED